MAVPDDWLGDVPPSKKVPEISPAYRAFKRITIFSVFIIFTSPCWIGIFNPRKTWLRIGAYQVLDGPGEVWIFVDVNRYVTRPSPLQSPGVVHYVSEQWVIVVTPRGVRSRQVLPSEDRPTFHPDITRIVRLTDGFYLFDDRVRDHPKPTISKWRGDRFTPTTATESPAAFEEIAGIDSIFAEPGLDTISERNGWSVTGDAHGLLKEYVSRENNLVIRRLRASGRIEPMALIAESRSKTSSWKETLIKVDPRVERVRRGQHLKFY